MSERGDDERQRDVPYANSQPIPPQRAPRAASAPGARVARQHVSRAPHGRAEAHTGTLDGLVEVLLDGGIRRLGGRLQLGLALAQLGERLGLGLEGGGAERLL